MKRKTLIPLTVLMLGCAAVTMGVGPCATTSSYISTAQQWLNNPANQALINQIANEAISLIGVFGQHAATANPAVVGKLAANHPDVPAGALNTIAQNPQAYVKK